MLEPNFKRTMERAMEMILIQEQSGPIDRLAILQLMLEFAREHAAAAVAQAIPDGAVVYVPTGVKTSRFKACEMFMDEDGELRYFNQETHWTWADDNPRPTYKRQEAPHGH